MKSLFVPLLALLFLPMFLHAQKGQSTCNGKKLVVNIKKGTLNRKKPTMSQENVKKKFPCSTGATDDGSDFNCGGGVFFLNHDFFFYTGRNYLEIRKDFKGKVSMDILGKSTSQVKKMLGEPDRIPKDYDSPTIYLYKMKYGTLELNFSSRGIWQCRRHAPHSHQ